MRTIWNVLKPHISYYGPIFVSLYLVGTLSAEAADTLTVTATDTLEVMPTPVTLKARVAVSILQPLA